MIEYAKPPTYEWHEILAIIPAKLILFERRGKVRIRGEIYQEWSPEFQEALEAEREYEKVWKILNG